MTGGFPLPPHDPRAPLGGLTAARAAAAGPPSAAGTAPARPLLPRVTDRVADALTPAGAVADTIRRLGPDVEPRPRALLAGTGERHVRR